MALALANWGRWQMGQAGRMLPVPGSVVSGRRRGDGGGGGRRGVRGVRVLGAAGAVFGGVNGVGCSGSGADRG